MVGWILILAVLAILSYLTDLGVITFMQAQRVPFLNASPFSILTLLCCAGLLIKMLWMRRKAEKEHLRERIQDLEKEIRSIRK